MTTGDSRTEQVFAVARELIDREARCRYLDRACGGDVRLRGEVDSLLAAEAQAANFMQAGEHAECGPSQTTTAMNGRGRRLMPPGIHAFRDYELLEEVARGGMGVVFKARQVSLNRLVAVKMILSGRLAGNTEIRRFRLEAESAAKLAHPNIVSIYEVGEHEGQPYFTMRFIEGRSLHAIVEDGAWKLDDGHAAARLLAKVARAVHYAHQRGIVHRDLKPGNILLDANGEPHITDFGLARLLSTESSLTLSGSVMGTPSFMAPEQAAGKFHKVTESADLYSLGAVLYYLLTGRPPFVAETPLDILVHVLDREALQPRAINPQVSRELERICLRCLEKSPERRYPSAGALADHLESHLKGEPIEMPMAGVGSRLRQWARREPALASRLLGILICATISHLAYRLRNRTQMGGDLDQHVQVMSTLGLWAVASVLCQRMLFRERWSNMVRHVWGAADVACLTAILHFDTALDSPLVALYPALVAGSGLWFQVNLVKFTTQLCALGYLSLWVVELRRSGLGPHPHWHLIFLAVLALTGFVVAYHVHRVRVLGRFSEWRAPS